MTNNELNQCLLLVWRIAGLLWCIFFSNRLRPLQVWTACL